MLISGGHISNKSINHSTVSLTIPLGDEVFCFGASFKIFSL